MDDMRVRSHAVDAFVMPSVFELNAMLGYLPRSFAQPGHPRFRPRSSPQRNIARVCRKILSTLPRWLMRRDALSWECKSKVLVLSPSFGHRKALEFLREGEASQFAVVGVGNNDGSIEDLVFNRDCAWITGARHIGKIFRDIRGEATKFQRQSLWHGLDMYVFCIGAYFEWLRWLAILQPKAVVVANDYNPLDRAFLFAANSLQIKSYYIPHALVGRGYYAPPRRIADVTYATCELEEMRIRQAPLAIAGKSCEIRRAERLYYLDHKVASQAEALGGFSIGISVNSIDRPETINRIVGILADAVSNLREIRIRFHPAMHSESYLAESLEPSLVVVDDGDLDTYFTRIDAHVAGATQMHLDAAMRGVPTYMYPEANKLDHYGFCDIGIASMQLEQIASVDFERVARQQHANASKLFASRAIVEQRQKEIKHQILNCV